MIVQNAIISFPNIFEPAEDLSGRLMYSCTLLINKTDKKMVEAILREIEKAKERGKQRVWGGKIPRFTYAPLRDGDKEIAEELKDKGKGYEGRFFFNPKSDTRPGIVGPDLSPIMDKDQIYAGCIVHADVSPYPYKNGGNCGIGWWLNNIMLVKECDPEDRLDGKQKAEVAFAEFATDNEDSTFE